jgi:hypothetical protein
MVCQFGMRVSAVQSFSLSQSGIALRDWQSTVTSRDLTIELVAISPRPANRVAPLLGGDNFSSHEVDTRLCGSDDGPLLLS